MKRSGAVLGAVLLVVSGAGVAGAAQRSDAPAGPCVAETRPYGQLCYYAEADFGGASAGFYLGSADLLSPTRWLYASTGGQIARSARSVRNFDTTCQVTIFAGPDHSGARVTIEPGGSLADLGPLARKNRGHKFHDCG